MEYVKSKCLRYFIHQVLQDYISRNHLEKLNAQFQKAEEGHVLARAIANLADHENLDDFSWN